MFWLSNKKKTLPVPEGPYVTGCVDVMDGCGKDSLFFRLLYPTDANNRHFEENEPRWVPWIPNYKYLESFSILLNLWLAILRFIIWVMGETHIPTLWEEPVTKRQKKLHVAVFSHGYGSTRFLCSTVCNELASRGYLVVCLEHKDLSASLTYYYASENARELDERTYVLAKPFVVPDEEHYLLRNSQMKYRSYECSKVLHLLNEINSGNFQNKCPKSNFDWTGFKDKIDLSDPILMGHSFGGATTLFTLANDDRYKAGIILDGWMFPLKNEFSLRINKPMLFVNSQTFHIYANIQLMKAFSSLPQSSLYTIRNTTHESHTDTPIVFGYWLNIFMRKLSGPEALQIQNYLILEFLHKYCGLKIDENRVQNYLANQSGNIVKDFILHTMQVEM